MTRSTRKGVLSGVAIAVLLGILVAAPGAQGQAALDQYVPSPGPPNTSSAPPPGQLATPTDPAAAPSGNTKKDKAVEIEPVSDGSSGGIELPVSDGYPVTPFVLLIAVLLACAVVARLILTGKRRKEGSV